MMEPFVVDDKNEPRSIPSKEPGPALRKPVWPGLAAKSALAAILLMGTITALSYGLSSLTAPRGDTPTRSERESRLSNFQALAPLPLSNVAASDMDRALEDMSLPVEAARMLRTDLKKAPALPGLAEAGIKPQDSTDARPSTSPTPAQAEQIRLVWISLWDTDAEDGDVVRIDSHGYSRTVTLAKNEKTFAVPVVANDVIKVTGIRDGDGGGITVGLGSGANKAIFPIMSEGQILGLQVKAD